MKFQSYSVKGFHSENEDALGIIKHPESSDALICVLCDGQGGREGGAVAARNAVKYFLEEAEKKPLRKLLTPITWVKIGEFTDKKTAEFPGAGFTTLIGLGIIDEFIIGVSCGDSKVLLLIENKPIYLTDRQRKHPVIGSSIAPLTPFSAKLEGNWKLLLMSDGVWKFIDENVLIKNVFECDSNEIIPKLNSEISNRFRELPDDFSVILIEA